MNDNAGPRAALLAALIAARNEQNRNLFLASIGGIGFDAVILFGRANLVITILLLISLAFFTLAAGAALAAFHDNEADLYKHLSDVTAEVPAHKLTGRIRITAFILAVMLMGAAIVVHLSMGGIT